MGTPKEKSGVTARAQKSTTEYMYEVFSRYQIIRYLRRYRSVTNAEFDDGSMFLLHLQGDNDTLIDPCSYSTSIPGQVPESLLPLRYASSLADTSISTCTL